MSGRISFIGAGPGAADLITVRAARRIAEADVVVWSASVLAPECVREHASADAELLDSSQLTHEQAVEVYRRAERDKLRVVRLHAGDPALWGSVQEQHDACAKMELDVEIVPGVNGFSAAAAAVGRELTVPEAAPSVLLTRLGGGSAATSDAEQVRELARHGTTMAVTLPASRAAQLVEELRAGGCADDIPVLVAYKVSWPDEVLLSTTVGELEQAVKQRKLWRSALFLVGKALGAGTGRTRGQHGESGYRRTDSPGRRRSYRSARRHTDAAPSGSDQEDVPGGAAVFHVGTGSADVERPGAGERAPASRRAAEPVARAAEAAPLGADTVTGSAEAEGTGAAVPNIAWWAVREWQEAARGAARAQARQRRTEDPAQPELFGAPDTRTPDTTGTSDEVGSAPRVEQAAETEAPGGGGTAVPQPEPALAPQLEDVGTASGDEPETARPTRAALSVVRDEPAEQGAATGGDTEPAAQDETAQEAARTSAASTTGTSRATAKTRSRAKSQSKAQTKAQTKASSAKSRAAGAKSAKNKGDASS
ncbi:SAM-dependent methyltransferase [Saccharopolyspora sp. NFXS83]|uniref:SAM-dependent methyltransferase n=1 Tax=Saccharopolyspora sp. NFXS83 TaxID=2993560 RepID=UPI00224AB65C|nr:SAM-dependent methyltransferase [Saccharopolyspora sp. NFXS83]MCX2734303.1 SAM-dependent methyltransferase [Saccharopolyspora sp. NFXS83]